MDLQIPKHVGFILDGNRRFGKIVLNDKLAGHTHGSNKVKQVLSWCKDFNIRETTMWIFSTENFNRPKKEVDMLMALFVKKLKAIETDKEIHQDKIQINFYGRIDLFPEEVQNGINAVTAATKDYDNYRVNFAVGYGGQQEILDVAKRLAQKAADGEIVPSEISNKDFEAAMYLDLPDIDLIIRTGGAKRTSGFMPWKGAYAEWYFTEKFWPEFDKAELVRALADYSDRQRRFGK
jgi:tritrans,polycis-undecaprenyl-diphosphate synthase [geranylgeranyl-diphosphate specific]